MAYRKSPGRKSRARKPKITMGKKFRTKRGRYGCYKYVNGRRVAFVTTSKKRRY